MGSTHTLRLVKRASTLRRATGGTHTVLNMVWSVRSTEDVCAVSVASPHHKPYRYPRGVLFPAIVLFLFSYSMSVSCYYFLQNKRSKGKPLVPKCKCAPRRREGARAAHVCVFLFSLRGVEHGSVRERARLVLFPTFLDGHHTSMSRVTLAAPKKLPHGNGSQSTVAAADAR